MTPLNKESTYKNNEVFHFLLVFQPWLWLALCEAEYDAGYLEESENLDGLQTRFFFKFISLENLFKEMANALAKPPTSEEKAKIRRECENRVL